MAEPILSPLGQRLRERTQPLAPDDATYGYAHAHLCEGMMLPFAQVAELVDPPDPYVPWEVLFDVDLCPYWALPWLGQCAGVRLSRGMSEADMRTAIKELGGAPLGSPQRIRAAIQLTLTGTKNVYFRERDGGEAYVLEVVTFIAETPDPAATQAAILAELPAAIKLQSRAVDHWDYQAMVAQGGTYRQQSAQYATYAQLSINEPT